MTTVRSAPRLASTVSTRAVVFELARFEGLRMLRSPFTWIGTAGSAVLMWYWLGGVAPILQRDVIFLAGAMLPLAASTLMAANEATLRRRRTAETLTTLPRGDSEPLWGVQSGVAAPVAVAIALQAIGMIYLLSGGPIGWIEWWELAVGPVMVGVFGLVGVLLGGRFAHSIVASVALVGIAFLQLIASPDIDLFSPEPGPTASVEWLAPWLIPSNFESVEGLLSRLSELHLIYLLLVGGLLVGLATDGRSRGIRVIKLSSAGVFSIAVVAISINMTGQLPTRFDWQAAAESQVCEVHDGVEYCAFNLYEPWIQSWQQTVEAVDALIPVALTRVVQRPSNTQFDAPGALEEPGLIISTTEWDREGALPSQGFNLALLAAHSSVGLPLSKQTREWTEAEIEEIMEQNPGHPADLRAQLESQPGSPRFCSAFGQARAVVAVWLAASALDRGEETLASQLVDAPPTRRIFWIPFDAINGSAPTLIEGVDAQIALQLLELPTETVIDILNDRWVKVVDPTTTSTELAGWFGLIRMSAPDGGAQPEEPCQ